MGKTGAGGDDDGSGSPRRRLTDHLDDLIAALQTGCGYVWPQDFERLTLADCERVFRYWQRHPPTHELVALIARMIGWEGPVVADEASTGGGTNLAGLMRFGTGDGKGAAAFGAGQTPTMTEAEAFAAAGLPPMMDAAAMDAKFLSRQPAP